MMQINSWSFFYPVVSITNRLKIGFKLDLSNSYEESSLGIE